MHGGPQVLLDFFANYLWNGYRPELAEYPVFDLRLLKCCIQWTAATVFGRLEPFLMTEIVINCIKSAETWDWMVARSSPWKSIITSELVMPHLVDVVPSFIGVWPFVVSYLKKLAKNDRNSLVVRSCVLYVISYDSIGYSLQICCLEEGDGRILVPWWTSP